MTKRLLFKAVTVALLLLGYGPAGAQESGGTVVSVLGTVQVRHPGSDLWEQAQISASLPEGSSVRTGERSAARLVLQDGSVVELASATEIILERIAVVAVKKRYLSRIRLVAGKAHVLVGEQYGVEGSRFDVETPTAVAGARGGGEFLVLYDRREELTTLVGLEQTVDVQGTIGLIGPGAKITPRMLTRIRRGRFPDQPEHVNAQSLAEYRKGLVILGTGNLNEGIAADHPAMNGRILRPEDLATAVAAESPQAAAPVHIVPDTSTKSLAESLSTEVRVDQQPIPEYRAARPGDRPIGGVQVDF